MEKKMHLAWSYDIHKSFQMFLILIFLELIFLSNQK